MYRLSIIIPVYNVAQYICDCLDSIIPQIFDGLEVILVDDGSTDQSGAICDDYASKNPCFKVIHQSNSGVSIARNNGIIHARGAWLSFVDPDDFISRDYISSFLAFEGTCDLVFFSLSIFSNDGQSRAKRLKDNSYSAYSLQQGILPLMRNEDNCEFFGFTVNKFFRSDIIIKYHIRFIEHLTFREDELFTLDYFKYITSYKTSSCVLYNYRCDIVNSLSHTPKKIEEMFLFVDAFLQKIQCFNDFGVLSMEYDRALHFLINSYDCRLPRVQKRALFERIRDLVLTKKEYLLVLKKTRYLYILFTLPRIFAFPILALYLKRISRINIANEGRKGIMKLW